MEGEHIEDLEVPESESEAVKGGDGVAIDGDVGQPVDGDIAKKLPGKRKPPTLTLK